MATVGGQTLLEAAREFSPHSTPSDNDSITTAAEKLKADGSMSVVDSAHNTCPNGFDLCDGTCGDVLPCFPCLEIKIELYIKQIPRKNRRQLESDTISMHNLPHRSPFSTKECVIDSEMSYCGRMLFN